MKKELKVNLPEGVFSNALKSRSKSAGGKLTSMFLSPTRNSNYEIVFVAFTSKYTNASKRETFFCSNNL